MQSALPTQRNKLTIQYQAIVIYQQLCYIYIKFVRHDIAEMLLKLALNTNQQYIKIVIFIDIPTSGYFELNHRNIKKAR